jgi:hypothetical protein
MDQEEQVQPQDQAQPQVQPEPQQYQQETNPQAYGMFDAGHDVPVYFAPFDPQKSQTKTVVYKTRFNEDGTNVAVDYPANATVGAITDDIKKNFKKDAADVQILMMLNDLPNPDGSAKTRDQKYIPSREEYDLIKPIKDEFKDPSPGMWDLAVEAGGSILNSAKALGVELFNNAFPSDSRKIGEDVFNVVEATSIAAQRTASLGRAALYASQKAIGSVIGDKEYSNESEYQGFLNGLKFKQDIQERAAGNELAMGQAFGLGTPEANKQLAKSLTPEQQRHLEELSGAVELGAFMVGGELVKIAGNVTGLSERIGENAVLKYMAPSVLVNEVAPKMAAASARIAGSAIEKVMKFGFNQLNSIIEGISEGAMSPAARSVGKMAAYGTGLYHAGSSIIGTALAGKTLSILGELGGVAVEAMAEQGSMRKALVGLAEDSAKSSAVRATARAASRIAPPDYLFNAMKMTADAAVNGGVFVGGLGAMQAYSSGDDPVQGFRDGFVSGYGMGIPLGVAGAVLSYPQFQQARAAKYFQADMNGRPETVRMTASNENGFTTDVVFNDMEGRADLFRRKDLTPDEKTMVVAMAKANEAAGGISIFHNNSPEVRAQMQDAGIPVHTGIQFINGPEGRPVVIFNVESIKPNTAVEELFHAKFSDQGGRMVADSLMRDLKAGGVDAFESEIRSFADKYINTLVEGAEGDAAALAHADQLRSTVDRAFDKSVPDAQREADLFDILNEYAAHYTGAALAGVKAEHLMDGRLRNFWDRAFDKVKSNILSALDVSKQGLRYDPIYGHFFDEKGRRTIMPEMEKMVKTFTEAIREGRKETFPEQTNDGANYFDIQADKPFVSPEDYKEGISTTKTQKKEILSEWFKENRQVFASTDPNAEVLISSDVKYRGDIHGNITKMKDGTPILFTRTLSDATIAHMGEQIVNGMKLHNPETLNAVKTFSDAAGRGQVIYIDAWHDIGRHTGDRSNVYYGRANRPVLPLGFQQTPTGGMEAIMLDVGRSWHRVKRFAEKVPAVAETLRQNGVDTLGEYAKKLQQYLDNYSSPDPLPAAELPGFSEPLRDAIAQSLNIGIRDAFRSLDEGNVANLHTFEGKLIPEQGDAFIELNGQKIKMKRDSQALMSIRVDRLLGTSEFRVDGNPVVMKYTSDVPNRVRANFAPRTTTVERIGSVEVKTDTESGLRMFTEKDGSTKLFMSPVDPPKKFSSQLDAETFANKMKLEIERALEESQSPEGVERQSREARLRDAKAIISQYGGSTKIGALADTTTQGKKNAAIIYNSIKDKPNSRVANSMSSQMAGFVKRNAGITIENPRIVPQNVQMSDFAAQTYLKKALDTYPAASNWIELGAINNAIAEAAKTSRGALGERSQSAPFNSWVYADQSLSSIRPATELPADRKLPDVTLSDLLKRKNQLLEVIKSDAVKIYDPRDMDRIASDIATQVNSIGYKSILDRKNTLVNEMYIKAYDAINNISPLKQSVFRLAARRGNKSGDAGFSDDPLISMIIEYGGIVSYKQLKERYKGNPAGLKNAEEAGYDYVKSKGGLDLSSPTHNKIFSSSGKGMTPDEILGVLRSSEYFESDQIQMPSIETPDELWSYIESASKSAKENARNAAKINEVSNVFDKVISQSHAPGFTRYELLGKQGSVIYTKPVKGKQYAIIVGETIDPLTDTSALVKRKLRDGELEIDDIVARVKIANASEYKSNPENVTYIFNDLIPNADNGIFVKSDVYRDPSVKAPQKRVLSSEDAAKQEAEFESRHSGVSATQSIEAFNNIVNDPKSSTAKIADSIADMYKEGAITLDDQNTALNALSGKGSPSVSRDAHIAEAKSILIEVITNTPQPRDPVIENAKQEMNATPAEYQQIPLGRKTNSALSSDRRNVMLKMAGMENARLLKEGSPGLDLEKIEAIHDDGEASGVFKYLTDKIVSRNTLEMKLTKEGVPAYAPESKPVVPLPSDVAKQAPAYSGPALTSYAEQLLARKAAKEQKPIRQTAKTPPPVEPIIKQVSTAPVEDLSKRTQDVMSSLVEGNPLVRKEIKAQEGRAPRKTEQQRYEEFVGKRAAARELENYKKMQIAGSELEKDVKRSAQNERAGYLMEQRQRAERTAQRKEDFTYALRQRALEVLRRKKLEERMAGFAELLKERDAQRAIDFEIRQKALENAQIAWNKKIAEWLGEGKPEPTLSDINFEEQGVNVTSPDLPKKMKMIFKFNGKIKVVTLTGATLITDDYRKAIERAMALSKQNR